MNVTIYKPAKSTMQSGRAKGQDWILAYDLESPRVPEPLMGWVSSKDTLNQVRLSFKSREDAIAYARAKGWSYTLARPKERCVTPRNYVDNFRYLPPSEG